MVNFPLGDDEAREKFREIVGPGQLDSMVRNLLNLCWMTLPKEKQNVAELKLQIRRLVDRAIGDLEEDLKQFGP